jgi:hypothetical protein
MTMILLVMGIRLLCYSFLVNPWYTLPIDLLNGLTLGVYWSAVRELITFSFFSESYDFFALDGFLRG